MNLRNRAPIFGLEEFLRDAEAVQLAARFGTPLYVYSAEIIRSRLRALDAAFAKNPHTICYSVKANSNLSLLKLIFKSGAGFDIVSGGELARVARAAPAALHKTVFSGVGKTAEEIDSALRANIFMFNVESESELRLLAARASALKKKARVALRVNPDIPAKTHPYISTGLRAHKFGVPISQALRLYQLAARQRSLVPCAVSLHIGSQIRDLRPFAAAMERAADLIRQLRSRGFEIQYLDAGGGLGIPYAANEKKENFDQQARAYASAITKPLRGLKLHLILEPGRSIVGPAGALLTRVLSLKKNGRKNFAVCDAAMNDLLRPALYGAHHEIALIGRKEMSAIKNKYDVVGPICETGDFFARDRLLPQLRQGDLLAILDAGAYGMSLASNYNSRARAAEVLIDNGKVRLIRRREITTDLMAQEI